LAVRQITYKFWASVAGLICIAICAALAWVENTTVNRTFLIEPGEGEMLSLFAFLDKPESTVLQAVNQIFVLLLLLSIAMILASIIVLALNKFNSTKLQGFLTLSGYALAAIVPLAFVVYTASVADPALLRPTLIPFLQAVIAVAAMVFALDRLNYAVKKDWQLYLLILPAFIMVFVFVYLPMYGIQVAFRDFKAAFAIGGSEWVGLKNFTDFFSSYYSTRLLTNTFLLNVYGLLWGFPIPIIMALLLNQLRWSRFKRITQTIIYSPRFISPVVLVGIIFLLLSPTTGLVNRIIEWAGGTPIAFMLEQDWFRTIFITTDVWQNAGWNTILYIAALTAIDPALYEAAEIDGASKLRKILHIDIPQMVPIIIMLFILNCGMMLASNTDKALLMQTDANIPTSDIIGLYVYRMGIRGGQYSYTAAINLLVNVINFFLIISVNWIARRSKQASLF